MQIVLSLIVVGVLLWVVNSYIPMAQSIKSILNAVVVIVVVVWLLNTFGFLESIRNFRVGGTPESMPQGKRAPAVGPPLPPFCVGLHSYRPTLSPHSISQKGVK